MQIREQTCCFTGHRILPRESDSLRENLRLTIQAQIEQGYRFFGSGGALGFDLLCAKTVLSLKPAYPHIRLIFVPPCRNHTQLWSPSQREAFRRLEFFSDKTVYLLDSYAPDCIRARNQHLVDHSSCCIAYYRGGKGGTSQTIAMAKQAGVPIIYVK